jgi:predicted MFS family arabinose efflux permease
VAEASTGRSVSPPRQGGGTDDGLSAPALRRVTAVLCITQIVAWGVLFYAFPVLAPTIAEREGWSLTTLMAAFTGTQILAALAGIWVGRHLDLRGPRVLMTVGSALGVVAVLALATAPTLPWFVAACAIVGAAMAASLYPPAFAALTHWGGVHRVRALTAVTLVGGLASTVFAPLTAVLEAAGSWRSTYAILAAPLAITMALHWIGLRAPWTPRLATERSEGSSRPRDPVLRDRQFVAVLAAMTLAGFAIYAALINLVPLLVESGFSTQQAAVVLAVGGAGQVAGRIAYARVLGPTTPDTKVTVVLLITTVTTLGLAAAPSALLALCAISVVAGTARGAFTLIQATTVTDRWGTASYGARTGVLSGGVHLAAATAPWLGALAAAALGGYQPAFVLFGACAVAAAVLPRVGARRAAPTS